MKMHRRQVIFIVVALIAVMIGIALSVLISARTIAPTGVNQESAIQKQQPAQSSSPQPIIDYQGQDTAISDTFSIKIPNGWRASIASQQSFLAVQFGRPSQISNLVYDKSAAPIIDRNGIPSWSGLTEHFYVRQITNPTQAFVPTDHAEVTSEPFTFKDGTVGQKYKVTKHAAEAQKWGGLLKDNEWYGRVHVYKKDGITIESHLAFYPSTKIDESFFEKVSATIHQ